MVQGSYSDDYETNDYDAEEFLQDELKPTTRRIGTQLLRRWWIIGWLLACTAVIIFSQVTVVTRKHRVEFNTQTLPSLVPASTSNEAPTRNRSTAYLILVHSPDRLEGTRQLIEQIHNPDDLFIIHVDSHINSTLVDRYKTAMSSYRQIEFVPDEARSHGQRTSWALIEVQLLLLRQALNHATPWTNAILLDGRAWPIGDRKVRQHWLERYDYVQHRSLPIAPPSICLAGKNRWKCNRTPARCTDRWCNRMTRTPGNALVRLRNPFFVLTRDSAEYIAHGPTAKAWIDFFKSAQNPDESFIVSVEYARPDGPKGWLPSPVETFWSGCEGQDGNGRCGLKMEEVTQVIAGAPYIFTRKILTEQVRRALVLGEPKSVSIPLPA